MKRALLPGLAALAIFLAAPLEAGSVRATFPAPRDSLEGGPGVRTWCVSFEQAWLREYDGNRNPYSYLSSMLSLDWEPWKPFVILGQPIRWQWRSTFVADAIMGGPETVYLGWAPQVRWIAPIGKSPFSLFAGGGAGPGWANASTAQVNDGGLGQPFTFIILGSGGFRWQIDSRWSAWLGIAYQHLSNAGLSTGKPNTGLDSLGVMAGTGFGF